MTENTPQDPNGWVLNPGYEIGFDPIPARVRVEFGGAAIAESSAARVMYELGHAPVYYLPRGDVDEESAAKVCYINYGVTFTMLSQQKVRGPDAHPVFQELERSAGAPTWNFNKYLVDRDGTVVRRFDSRVDPMSR